MTYSTPPRKHRLRKYLFIILGIGVLAALLWYIQPNTGAQQATNRRHIDTGPVPVQAAVAHKGDIDIIRHELGAVTPLATITVQTQINGQLTDVAFKEGQTVQKGDFLAQIDARPYEVALEQAQGSLQRDQALLKEAELDLVRYQKLVAQDSLARQQLDTQTSLVEQYKGNVLTDQGQIDAAKLNINYCHITAPITGLIGIRQVDPGNYVQTSSATGLVTLTQVQPISALFTIPEDDVPLVMKRLKDGAELQVTAYDRTQSTKLAIGKLIATNSEIDPTTGTLKLRALFDNQDSALFPQQFVNVELLVDTLHNAVVVPSAAVQRGAPGTFVYLIKDDNTVSVQIVKVGPTQGDQVAILDGLTEGNKVVTEGTDKLRDGSKITLPNETKGDVSRPTSDNPDNKAPPQNGLHHHGDP